MRNGNKLQFFLNIGDAAAHQPLDGIDGAVGMRRSARLERAVPPESRQFG